jgi:glycosyltransferase involved in cell wall biosynthesis
MDQNEHPHVSAAIPCHNGGLAIRRCLASLRRQNFPIDEIFVVDDGSNDRSCAGLPVPVFRLPENQGRGAARAETVRRATGLFLLSCDATKEAPPDFLERAMRWVRDERVAAVFGSVRQVQAATTADRWRGRHLFRLFDASRVNRRASLATTCCLLRLSAVRVVGNFNESLREREDQELGERLINAGFEVVFDPDLFCLETRSDTLGEVLSRYARWNLENSSMTLSEYRRQITYAYKVLLSKDCQERDLPAAMITLLLPHYLFWKQNFAGPLYGATKSHL